LGTARPDVEFGSPGNEYFDWALLFRQKLERAKETDIRLAGK
jgi:hypothetical protein